MALTTTMVYDDTYHMSAHERARIPMIVTGFTILIIGTIGNILAFFILRRKALRVYTTAFLLSLLAICDTACLYLGLLSKVLSYYYRGIDVFRTVLPYSCQIHVFLLYTALHYTSWMLALVSVERFISTWFPHRSLTLCSVRNAKIAAFVLFAIIVGYQSHFFYTMELQVSDAYSQLHQSTLAINSAVDDPGSSNFMKPPSSPVYQQQGSESGSAIPLLPSSGVPEDEVMMPQEQEVVYDCKEMPEFEDFHRRIWPMIDLVLFCFGPFGVMLVTNTLIAWRILQMRREGELVVASTSPARRLSGMTMIMFSCTLTFFALTFPISVYILVRRQYSEQMSNPAVAIVWPAVNLLQYVNNAINFFLYCLTGSMFRRELRRFLQDWLIKIQSLISVLSATISEEKADRAAAANSNGHLVLVEIGGNGRPRGTGTHTNYSRSIIQRLMSRNQTELKTRTTCPGTVDPYGDPYAVTNSMPAVICHRNGDSDIFSNNCNHHHIPNGVGTEEPLLNGKDGCCEAQLNSPQHRVPQIHVGSSVKGKRGASKRLKMPKIRSISSKFAERFRFHFDDSEATSGCYNSTAALEIAGQPPPPVANDYNYNDKILATIADTNTNSVHDSNTDNAVLQQAVPRSSNSTSSSSRNNNKPFIPPPASNSSVYRYQRRITAEEKALLEEFGPHC